MEIGFIGLGNLGTPIAENILEKGQRIFVYNRTTSKAQSLVEKGATMCSSIKELAQKCDMGDSPMVRLTFAFRFGQMDMSLFKRKNMKGEAEGTQGAMQGMGQ